MRTASERALLRKPWLRLLALGAISLLIGGAAYAQNLDQGKSPAKLFADGCATCHHSARGLTKGRFRLTLFMFLQDHYATNSSSAWALSSYLESVDSAQRGRSRRREAGACCYPLLTVRDPPARIGAGALAWRARRSGWDFPAIKALSP